MFTDDCLRLSCDAHTAEEDLLCKGRVGIHANVSGLHGKRGAYTGELAHHRQINLLFAELAECDATIGDDVDVHVGEQRADEG